MTLVLGARQLPNSSTAPPMSRGLSAGASPRSEGFSALMRSKQEASRVEFEVTVGGRLRPSIGPVAVAAPGGGKASGPQVDFALPASEREEFQRYGHDRSQHGASDALSLSVDPLQRVLAYATPPPESVAPHVTNPALATDELWRAVRRIAWGGDRQRSVAYIELGAGDLNGACVTLEARGSAISLVVDLPPGASGAGWAQRLSDRLARRGLEVQSVEVR